MLSTHTNKIKQMFSGIVESTGKVLQIIDEGKNRTWWVQCSFADELYIDQSIAHNGVCLTVTEIKDDSYSVVMIDETLKVSSIGDIKEGAIVNLERCMKMDDRLDGHIVQGHVDGKAKCIDIRESDGSWYFTFNYQGDAHEALVFSKGSICVNGTSLTVVEPTNETFKVAIIPYTYEHTQFQELKVGDMVNLEYDIIGKYVQKNLQYLKK